jgi:hypothetical protein
MCLCLHPGVKFWWELVEADRKIAEEIQQKGCRHCKGTLHRANYPRKPRGDLGEAEEAFLFRHSFCCGHCRKRTTPPSLRFFGRKVYVGQLVIAACLFSERLSEVAGKLILGVPRRTVARWLSFWRTQLPLTRFWCRARSELIPAVDETKLPRSLYERFGKGVVAFGKTLAFTSPLTTRTSPFLRVHFPPAEDGVRG